jgi:hypothetical protein
LMYFIHVTYVYLSDFQREYFLLPGTFVAKLGRTTLVVTCVLSPGQSGE